MPGGDGTGPTGAGPMTGRGAGFCAGYSVPGYANAAPRGGYAGNRGPGGRRNWYYATGIPGWARYQRGMPAWGGRVNPAAGGYNYPEMSPKEQADMLKRQSEDLKRELEDMKKEIQRLEKEASKQKE
ncbi:MAG: DUF5320 domain-containing protein [Elusimicrobiota bacterium]